MFEHTNFTVLDFKNNTKLPKVLLAIYSKLNLFASYEYVSKTRNIFKLKLSIKTAYKVTNRFT